MIESRNDVNVLHLALRKAPMRFTGIMQTFMEFEAEPPLSFECAWAETQFTPTRFASIQNYRHITISDEHKSPHKIILMNGNFLSCEKKKKTVIGMKSITLR